MPAVRRSSRRTQDTTQRATRRTRRATANIQRSPSPAPSEVIDIDIETLTPKERSLMCVEIIGELKRFSDLVKPSFRKLFNRKRYERASWLCPFCGAGQGRKTPSDLAKHMWTHCLPEDWPFACDICGKRSSQLSNIREHQSRVHLGDNEETTSDDNPGDLPCGVILAECAPDGSVMVCSSLFQHSVKRTRHKNDCHFPDIPKEGRRTFWPRLKYDEQDVTYVETKKGEFRLGIYEFKGGSDGAELEETPRKTPVKAKRTTPKKTSAKQPKQTARSKLPARPTVQKKAAPEPQVGPIRTLRRSARLAAPYRFAPSDAASDQDEAEVLTHLTSRISLTPSSVRSPSPETERGFDPGFPHQLEFEPEPEPAQQPTPLARSRANTRGTTKAKAKATASTWMSNAHPEEPSASAGPSFYYKNGGVVISPEAEKENEAISQRIMQGLFSYVPPHPT